MAKTAVFSAKTKLIPIVDWEDLIVLINEIDAWENGISSFDKVIVRYKGKDMVFDASVTTKYVKPGEVGFYEDVVKKYEIEQDVKVVVKFTQTDWAAIAALKKGITWGKLNYEETYSIMKNIAENRFTDTLVTYYSAIWFFTKTSDYELYEMAKAMAETGEMLKFDGVVADKHCMWGVPGNETTMIIIPLLASLGIKMPKTFSKAITSPAATGECVNVLMNISFNKSEIEQLVNEQNCCLVRGGGLDLAPADEKLIRVAYPLSMQSYSRTVVSIMAKKYAMGVTHLLLDIPMGPTAKVPDMKTAKWLKRKYEYVGKKLGIKVEVAITDAIQPIWGGIGATLQVREVLRVLQQHPSRPKDLEEKSLLLASKIIELVWIAKWKKALALARETLVSWKAWAKMQSIIKAQWWKNPNITSENLKLADFHRDILAPKDGTIKAIDMKLINTTTRTLGAPIDDEGGLYLRKKVGDKVKKGDVIYTMYTNEESKIDLALENLEDVEMYAIR